MKGLTLILSALGIWSFSAAQEDIVLHTTLENTGGVPVTLTFTIETADGLFTAIDTTDEMGEASTAVTVEDGGFLGGLAHLSFDDCSDSLTTLSAYLMPLDSTGGGLTASFLGDYCPSDNPTGGGGGDPVVDDCEVTLSAASTDGMWFDFLATGAPAGEDLTWSINGAVVGVSPDTVMSQGFDFTPDWVVCVSYESDSCGVVMDCVSSEDIWGGGGGGGGNDSLCTAAFTLSQTLDADSNLIAGSVDAWLPEVDGNATYFWEFGDEGTSNEPTPTHTYEGNGPYLLCLTIVYPDTPMFPGCTAVHCDTVSIDEDGMMNGLVNGFTLNVQVGTPTVVEVSEMTATPSLRVFPNPATPGGILHIDNAFSNYALFTAWGTVAQSGSLTGTELLLDAALPRGTYLLRITDESGQPRRPVRVMLE